MKESLKTTDHRGYAITGFLYVEPSGKKHPQSTIDGPGLSLSTGDDCGEPLRGVAHAIEAAKTVVDWFVEKSHP